MDGRKDPWPRVLSLPGWFVGDPASLARDNILSDSQCMWSRSQIPIRSGFSCSDSVLLHNSLTDNRKQTLQIHIKNPNDTLPWPSRYFFVVLSVFSLYSEDCSRKLVMSWSCITWLWEQQDQPLQVLCTSHLKQNYGTHNNTQITRAEFAQTHPNAVCSLRCCASTRSTRLIILSFDNDITFL